ncbi:MAG TPA: hypothetical protein PLK90_02140 [Clostridiales bacterium]|nr:hypothetical protein [Clostridiales bacterium]HQP69177.1 hypothetical protein [Clostridiales bacterium]
MKDRFLPDLKETTFRWYVYELKKYGVLDSVKRGVYKISENNAVYAPLIEKIHKKISNLISTEYPDVSYCVWSSNWFNQFSVHQASGNIVIVEVEKDLMLSIFYLLSDKGLENIYINPDKKTYDTYISKNKESIIVKQLVTKSPLKQIKNVKTPKIEKMLVDLISDTETFISYQGYESITILKNAFKEYQINFTTMINYSRRRKMDNMIKNILEKEVKISEDLLK